MSNWVMVLPQYFLSPSQPGAAPRYYPGAPEIYLSQPIDNSRLVKVEDKERKREMAIFGVALLLLALMAMVYVTQHLSSIEYGYKIEKTRQQLDQQQELNRSLQMEEATLKAPERIDAIARGLGMHLPAAGQVRQLEGSPAPTPASAPVLARASGIAAPTLTE
jgi:cell division protein FtsL